VLTLRKIADRLVGLSALVGALALAVVTVTILVDVTGRAFGHPLYGSRDIVQMAAVLVVFGGMGYADKRGGHIAVDLLEPFLSKRLNYWLVTAGVIVGTIVFTLIAWRIYGNIALSQMLKSSTNILYIPRWPFEYAVMTLAGIAALYMALKVVTRLLGDRDES